MLNFPAEKDFKNEFLGIFFLLFNERKILCSLTINKINLNDRLWLKAMKTFLKNNVISFNILRSYEKCPAGRGCSMPGGGKLDRRQMPSLTQHIAILG